MKELLKKKSVQISILLIILIVVIGIVGINVRSAGSRKAYAAHMEAAEKYLSDLDYEQAIAEYTMAFEIEPKEEVVEALEQTYLAYAQVCVDAEDYEKAVSILSEGYEKIGHESFQEAADALEQTYLAYAQVCMDAGNYEQAISILSEGYEKLERESLQNELAAVTTLAGAESEAVGGRAENAGEGTGTATDEQQAAGMVEFPFQMTDITVMGYDLAEDWLAQLQGSSYLQSNGYDGFWNDDHTHYTHEQGTTSDGGGYSIGTYYGDGIENKQLIVNYADKGNWDYSVSTRDGRTSGGKLTIYINSAGGKSVYDDAVIRVPVTAGESYEDWCRVMQIDRIKENNLRPEERDGMFYMVRKDGSLAYGENVAENKEPWLFSTAEYQGLYTETYYDNGGWTCTIRFAADYPRAGKEQLPSGIIAYVTADGVIERITYMG